jgi:hypothetical protein
MAGVEPVIVAFIGSAYGGGRFNISFPLAASTCIVMPSDMITS